MNKTVVKLVDGIVNVDPRLIVSPNSRPSPNEVIIGELNDPELRQFHAYQHELGEEIRKKIEEIQKIPQSSGKAHDLKTCPRCSKMREVTHELEYSKAVSDLFWSAVVESLPPESVEKLTKIGGIGIRNGWKIVAMSRHWTTFLSQGFPITGGMIFQL